MACTRSTWRNFNPRTPVGCDRRSKLAAELTNTISIHAPQWGATVEIRTAAMAHPISIHAPQWGATRWCPSRRRTGRNFNPRTPVGCDPVGYVLSHSMGIFQSTHPSGVRQPCALIHLTAISYFNPRTPVGCDQEGLPPQDRRGISIHAPQWGATSHPRRHVRHGAHISIHAPQWGATVGVKPRLTVVRISIHAPQWGATWVPAPVTQWLHYFNPRTPVGCDTRF